MRSSPRPCEAWSHHMPHFCTVAVILFLIGRCDVKWFPHYLGLCSGPSHLFLQPLQHGSQQSLPVLLNGLHLLLQFFLGVLDEVVVLLKGLLDHLALMLPLLCQVLQQFGLLALEGSGEQQQKKNACRSGCLWLKQCCKSGTPLMCNGDGELWCSRMASAEISFSSLSDTILNGGLQKCSLQNVGLTFRRSSAASSFFWISSRDGSRRCGMEVLSSGTPSKDGGLRMTSKAWPDARLFSSITSTSFMTHQPRSTASVGLDWAHEDPLYVVCPPPTPPPWDPFSI